MWNSVKTKPLPKDRPIDVWCEHPCSRGVRFANITYRSVDDTFGFVIHSNSGVQWEKLESDEGVYPKWIITHWMEQPEGPNA